MQAENKEPPRLHQSTAHVLLSRSPLHAWYSHPELGGKKRDTTSAMERGSIIDRMLLGVGPNLAVIDPENYPGKKGGIPTGWTTDAIREARDEARAAGRLPILRAEFEEYEETVTILRARLEDLGIRLSGESQVNLKWNAAVAGVACEGTLDHLILREGQIFDLKTTTNASPDAIALSMVKYGSDIQHAAYTEAVTTLYPELRGRVRMRFLYCEVEPPFAVTPAEPAGTMRALGLHKWRRACEKWAECIASNEWPGYATDTVRIEAKPWQLAEEAGGEDDGLTFD